jgi:alanyl-tRNA synthetase
MQSANDIRAAFLDYFAGKDHQVVASGPLVPHNDPTLLFTNAGMVQFKNLFTGSESRDYSRAVTSQKCVRAGGKHNDLDNVGYTTRHHTFFEMLGNFSFGDYFKDRAIELAWDLINGEFGISKDKLVVTVYADDEEAYALWRKISGLPDERIIRINTADNFWSMGATGPCGPCAEIFYDHGEEIPGGPPGSPDQDGDRFVEIWNLVFMQYEQLADGKRIDLPRPSIDTGMGLERVAAVLQGVHDNYDTDLMRSLITASAEVSGQAADGDHAVSHRVIADHLRSCCFLMADGVLPSNEGRGYVLRRIMRRAMRHVHLLGMRDPMMWRLVPALNAQMGPAFPELLRADALITETLKLEEARFQQTLERGLRLLFEATDKLSDKALLPGDVAFKLYDTYGFPLDLTEDVLRGQGRSVEVEGFNTAMERQRAEARANWSGSGEAATEQVWFDIRQRVGATEFLGYDAEIAEGEIVALVRDGVEVSKADAGETIAVVTNQTPFYGESGGQTGDTGILIGVDPKAKPLQMAVRDTKKYLGDFHVHMGEVGEGTLKCGDIVELRVDTTRRNQLRANHSATHLLHAALRNRLGDHVTQKGSLVAPDRLRFDVAHPKAISIEEMRDVEQVVNARIRENAAVSTRLMTPDEAIEEGAMALFGEKYGDEVRVVSMGGSGQDHDGAASYSVELCGGTHVRRTGDIGFIRIIAESAVGAGIRRIEALTGSQAESYINSQDAVLAQAAGLLKVAPADMNDRLSALIEDRKRLEKELIESRRSAATGGGGVADDSVRDVNGVKFCCCVLEDVPPKELKPMADDMKARMGSGVVALVASGEGKASLVVAVTDDLTDKISAVDLVRAGAEALGGKGGGGRPDMAQAGGPDGAKAEAALAAIEKILAS